MSKTSLFRALPTNYPSLAGHAVSIANNNLKIVPHARSLSSFPSDGKATGRDVFELVGRSTDDNRSQLA